MDLPLRLSRHVAQSCRTQTCRIQRAAIHRAFQVCFSSSSDSDDTGPGGAALHATFEQQMKDLQDERQSLFGFTKEEHDAWGAAKVTSQTHSSEVLESVEQARQSVQAQSPVDTHSHKTQVSSSLSSSSSLDSVLLQRNSQLTHVSSDGASVHMVDVGHKKATRRTAKARTRVVLPPEVMAAFHVHRDTDNYSNRPQEMIGPKGPIFSTAKVAGILAAKKTSDLIPLCHPLPLDTIEIDIVLETNTVTIDCECRVTHTTGVEMEALTGCSVAALTIYDMVKAVSHRVTIEETVLIGKTGGKRTIQEEQVHK